MGVLMKRRVCEWESYIACKREVKSKWRERERERERKREEREEVKYDSRDVGAN